MTTKQDLTGEAAIVWSENIERYDYVRQTIVNDHHRRTGPIRTPAGRIVGYSDLRPDTAVGAPRRVFWVNTRDRSEYPSGPFRQGCPHEAVDPRTVQPGVPGRITDRARHGQ